jgi:RNA polymerase sigma-70 factor, ECF subfamily
METMLAAAGTISKPLVMPRWLLEALLHTTTGADQQQRHKAAEAMPAAADLDDVHDSRNGDADAFKRLIQRHQAEVGRLLWRFTRHPAEHEELLQQVFIEAYLGLGGYRAKAPLAHWLARIAVRVGYRYWKNCRRRRTENVDDQVWKQLVSRQPQDPRQAAEIVHQLLAMLPPRDRLVLTLRYLEQCDAVQTARRMGWSTALVRVQTHRAIGKLRKLAATAGMEVQWP